jgi:Short C-terminal domain
MQQQQQGSGYGAVSFTSQFGTFDVSSLPEAETPAAAPAPQYQSQYQSDRPAPQHQSQYQSGPAPRFPPQTRAPEPASGASGDLAAIVTAIESLAGLHQRGILSDEEFAAKKTELLGRL